MIFVINFLIKLFVELGTFKKIYSQVPHLLAVTVWANFTHHLYVSQSEKIVISVWTY